MAQQPAIPLSVTNRPNLFFSPSASVRVFFLLLEFPTVPRAACRSAEPVTANCRHLNFALASPHRPKGTTVNSSSMPSNWLLEPSFWVQADLADGHRPSYVLYCA